KPEENALLDAGDLKEPDKKRHRQSFRDTKTGRHFLYRESVYAYQKRYNSRDLTGFERLAEPPLDTTPAPRRSKGGRPQLSPKEIERFQTRLRDIVLELVAKYGPEDPVKEGQVIHRWPGKMTERMWRTRYARTREDWHCDTWDEIIFH